MVISDPRWLPHCKGLCSIPTVMYIDYTGVEYAIIKTIPFSCIQIHYFPLTRNYKRQPVSDDDALLSRQLGICNREREN